MLSLTAACYATRGWTVSINHSLNNDDGLNPVQLKSETTTSPDSSVLQHKREICHTQFWGTQWASGIGNAFLSTGIYTCYPTWEVQWRERDAAWQHWMWEIITWTIIWHTDSNNCSWTNPITVKHTTKATLQNSTIYYNMR